MGLAKVINIMDIADIADILQIYYRHIIANYGEKWQIVIKGVIGHIP